MDGNNVITKDIKNLSANGRIGIKIYIKCKQILKFLPCPTYDMNYKEKLQLSKWYKKLDIQRIC